MSKEKILKEFDKMLGGEKKHLSDYYINDVKQFISQAIEQAIDQTREETIREVEEMLSKIVLKDLSGKWSEEVIDFSTSIVNATVSKMKQSLKSLINK